MKISIFAIILIMAITSIQAQNSIYGTITDSKTMEPIQGVSVNIPDMQKGTTSNIEGKYWLNNIQQSDIQIVYSYTGYLEQQINIQFNTDKKEQNIALNESVFELDEVMLSTPFNKLQSENVVKVSYKSLASMQKKGIQNLMDGVSQISGVTQMSTGSGISKPVIRGLTGSRVLVYNQGVRLENFQFGEEHGIGVNESGIGSVEVIKGPASLLYGSDAVGGVLYLIPEKFAPKDVTKINLKSQYTSNTLGVNSTLGVKTSFDKFQFLARGAFNTNADYAVADGDRVTNSRYNDRDFKAGLGFKGNLLTTDIRYNFNRAENGIPHDIEEQETTHEITGKHQGLDNHILSVKNDIELKNSKIKTNLGHTWHTRTLINEGITLIGMQLNTLNYDVKWYLPNWNKLESIIGIQGMNQTNENFGTGFLLPDATINSLGIFTNLHYKFENLTLQGGIRYDGRTIITKDISEPGLPDYRAGFDKNLSSFTSSIGLKSTIFNKTTVRLNLATGFRAPNLSELASKGIHEERIEIGNSELENEHNWQGDLALEYANTHIEFFLNGFVNSIQNYIYITPTGDVQDEYAIYQYKQDNAQLFGGEIGFHLHPHPYDWLHYDSSFETVVGKREDASYLPLIPANQWKNQLRLTNDTKHNYLQKYYLNIGVNHTFKADKIDEFEVPQNAYTLLNSSLGADFKFNKVSVNTTLSVHNLLDTNYISHLSVLREHDVPNMGRNLILSLNLNF